MAVGADQLTVPVCELEQPKQALHALITLRTARHSIEVGDEVQELASGEVRMHERFFIEVAEPRLRAQRVLHDVDPVDEGSPRGGSKQTAEHAKRGGLARAVGAEEAK